ncbi:NHLP bacteriocin export ABC transporter permease/ATPase subunit [Streptomyces sp. NPDC095817]|uniref:NHLP bacteriocin export ABC transporter permease/ATPase subunit n=1 Tax=Streptomyces sp. NPDC095817 TaxID=3155082 RepID=UPI00333027CF
MMLITSAADSQHSLILKPSANAELRSIPLDKLALESRTEKNKNPSRQQVSPWEQAAADAIDRGLNVLMDFIQADLPPKESVSLGSGEIVELTKEQIARLADRVGWVDVLEGELKVSGPEGLLDRRAGDWAMLTQHDWLVAQTTVRLLVRSTHDLCRSGQLWPRVTRLQNHVLYMVDKAIERQEGQNGRQIGLGRDATNALMARAERSLGNVLRVAEHNNQGTVRLLAGQDPTIAACRAVADAMGIPDFPTDGPPVHTQSGPIEQAAIRARLRTRTISLTGKWWRNNIGPFVGHRTDGFSPTSFLWQNGKYRAWDPVTGVSTTLTEKNATEYETRAVVFYKPLPEGPISLVALVRAGLHGAARDVWIVVLGTLFAVTLGALVPISTGALLGTFVPAARTDVITQVCIFLLLAGVASAAFAVMQNMALLRIEGRFEGIVQAAVWDRLLRLPAGFFKNYSTGELASSALGVGEIRAAVAAASSTVLYSAVVAAVNLLVLFWVNIKFATFASVLAVVALAVSFIAGRRQLKWHVQSLQLRYMLTNKIFQKLRGLPKLRVAAAEDRAYADWALTFSNQKEIQKRIGRFENGFAVFNAAYPPFCLLLFFFFEAKGEGGTIPVPDFLTFMAALTIMLSAVTRTTSGVMSTISVVPIFNRLKAILEHPLEVDSTSNVPTELSGDIEVSHLTFGYSKDTAPVLNDVSFRVSPGEFLAIVGASGGGKSTLLRMLLGFEKPDAGTVLYDGQDLSSTDAAAVRRQCGVVLQQTKPPTGTIFEAITGAMNYSLADAWAAAECAGLSEDIRAMPMGMHTLISDGSTLSGGQRQRLAIAQALIRRPRILFFDEATSALDNHTQKIVTEATQSLRATRIVIAHRLSTVMDADRILVLSDGRVAQYGAPAALMADKKGLFYKLVRHQMQ